MLFLLIYTSYITCCLWCWCCMTHIYFICVINVWWLVCNLKVLDFHDSSILYMFRGSYIKYGFHDSYTNAVHDSYILYIWVGIFTHICFVHVCTLYVSWFINKTWVSLPIYTCDSWLMYTICVCTTHISQIICRMTPPLRANGYRQMLLESLCKSPHFSWIFQLVPGAPEFYGICY